MNQNTQMAETAVLSKDSDPRRTDDTVIGPMAMSILEAYSDSFSRAILNSITMRGKSIEEITMENSIPISTTYRRVHYLCENGLVMVERMVFTEGGKKHAIFRSTFQGARFEFQSGGVKVVGTPNEGISDIAFRIWRFNNRAVQPSKPDR